ncbi:ABC transporter permease [Pontibacter beigongshangensis]|uniref:ABC transporter permease n=1 Tax=Pontibacter beigongshangensis TaxID=2574733 RepID=UPI001F507376|nr:ABC transporter permease [Pontibacter beigongshangensis]
MWKNKLTFRAAVCYLLGFVLLALLLPWLPLPFGPNELHLNQVYQPPFESANSQLHLFGTDALGRDVFVNTLYGARTAFFISFPVAAITLVLGLTAGVAAGYFGNSGFRVSRASFLGVLASISFMVYLGLYIPLKAELLLPGHPLALVSLGALLLLLLLLWFVVVPLLQKFAAFRETMALPLDQLLLRLIETFTSIPRLIFILVLSSFLPPTVLLLTIILVLTYWTGTARLARAEMLKIKHLPYFESARSLGLTSWSLIFRHALPNMLGPLLVSFTFGLASLLAFESTLSFLGIGIPNEIASWGRMIAGIRHNTAAWWLLAFPGGFLLLTVFALQVCNYFILTLIQQKKL